MLDQLHIARLDAVVEQARNAAHAPGVIIGIAMNDREPIIVANGIGDASARKRLLPTDRLRIGSITKTFTAVTILNLVENGVLRLNDPVSQWITAIPYADAITVEHLLRHTSGLYNYTNSQGFFSAVQDAPGISKVWTPYELIAYATRDNQVFAPGAGWSYSNTNYILLGMIIQAATQQSLAQNYRQIIFAPLGMNETFLDGEEVITGGFIPGYATNPETPSKFLDMTNFMHVSAAWAAGGIVSTAKDLLTFNRAIFSGNMLNPASFAQMKKLSVAVDPTYAMVKGYGLGLVAMDIAGKLIYGHIGNIPGYSSLMAYFPEDQLYLVVLMNQNYTRVDGDKVNVEIIAEKMAEEILSKSGGDFPKQ